MTPETPPSADELGHELAMQLRAAYARLRRHSNQVFSAYEMTADQYVLLTVLARRGEATQQELTQHCYSDTATIGSMVTLLESKQLVTRTPHRGDRRAWSVALTPPGRALAEQMWRGSTGLRLRLAGLLAEPELRLVLECLNRLTVALRPPGRSRSAGRRGRCKPRPSVRSSRNGNESK